MDSNPDLDEDDDRKLPAVVIMPSSRSGAGSDTNESSSSSSSSEDESTAETSDDDSDETGDDDFIIKKLKADVAFYDRELKLLSKDLGDDDDDDDDDEDEEDDGLDDASESAGSPQFTAPLAVTQNRKTKVAGVLVEDDMWEVDDFHDFKDDEGDDGETMWLISWVGYPKKTWEPDSYLSSSAKAAAEEFRATKVATLKDDEDVYSGEKPRPAKKPRKRPPQDQRAKKPKAYSRSRSRNPQSPQRQSKRKASKSVEEKETEVVSGSGKARYWAVEKVLDYDKAKNKYLIRWQGCTEEDDSWEPRSNLDPSIWKEAGNVRERVLTEQREQESPLELNQSSPFAESTGMLVQKMKLPVQQYIVGGGNMEETYNFLRLFVQGQPILNITFRFSASKFDNEFKPQVELVENGITYALVVSKTPRDKNKCVSRPWARKEEIDFKYVAIRGPGLAQWNPKKELEKVADFQSVPTHKVPARLELLLTPAKDKENVFDRLTADNFEVLEEEDSHMGCGFIPESFVQALYHKKKDISQMDAFQVRIFAPKIGIAKGMLTRKLGINKIQLPPSMVKVGPSRECNDEWAVMIVKAIAPGYYKIQLGKYLDPVGVPNKSYVKEPVKEQSPM
jgi:hypothetical protein